MRPAPALAIALAAAVLALPLAGCGGDDGDSAAPDATETETSDTTETDTTGTDGTETTQAGGALKGSVGPGFDISLTTADGEPVSTLAPGSYELEIEDLSSAHNFHLSGPGVDISTEVAEEGTENASLTVTSGSYTFVCDPHSFSMSGSFEVG